MEIILILIGTVAIMFGPLWIISKIAGISFGQETDYDPNEWYGGGPDPMGQ